MIEVSGLTKLYGDFVAVEDLSFSVGPTEVLGLVGPNGAGKTTTLRCLTGIVAPSKGRVAIAGHDLRVEPVSAKARLAFVPDEPQLFDYLTVEEHLRFMARLYNVETAPTRIPPLLAELELSEKQRAFPTELSRGMRQKLAICCAYLHDPQAILVDEPLTGLDPHGIRVFKRSLQERAARGAAVMISSHMLAMVEDLCTHVLILDRGIQRFFGPVDELRTHFDLADGDASLEDIFFAATIA